MFEGGEGREVGSEGGFVHAGGSQEFRQDEEVFDLNGIPPLRIGRDEEREVTVGRRELSGLPSNQNRVELLPPFRPTESPPSPKLPNLLQDTSPSSRDRCERVGDAGILGLVDDEMGDGGEEGGREGRSRCSFGARYDGEGVARLC